MLHAFADLVLLKTAQAYPRQTCLKAAECLCAKHSTEYLAGEMHLNERNALKLWHKHVQAAMGG